MQTFTQRSRRLPAGLLPRVVVAVALTAIVGLVAALLASSATTSTRVSGAGKDYGLPATSVTLQLREDGDIDVTERITFDFNGSFSGAYRDIPVRADEQISDVQVCGEAGAEALASAPTPPDVSGLPPDVAKQVLEQFYRFYPQLRPGPNRACPPGLDVYTPGASTTLGSYGTPGSFGVQEIDNPDGQNTEVPTVTRVVWHYSAYNEPREFTIRYRASGWLLRTANPEMLVLRATPWGSEWKGSLGYLSVSTLAPAGTSLGGSDWQAVGVGRGAARVRVATTDGKPSVLALRASDVGPGERVELQALVSAAALGVATAGLPAVDQSPREIGRDMRAAERAARARERTWNRVERHAGRNVWIAGATGLVLAGLWLLLAWRLRLKEEPWPEDVPRLLAEPPSDLAPALAVSLVEQRTNAPATALVSTVFDLVRRDAWRTLPASSAGKGTEVDIALKVGERPPAFELRPFETHALNLVDTIVETDGDGVAMGSFKRVLRKDLSLSRKVGRIEGEHDDAVEREIAGHNWYVEAGWGMVVWPRRIAFLGIVVSIVALSMPSVLAWNVFASDPRTVTVLAAMGLALCTGIWLTLLMPSTSRLLRRRWTDDARRDAAEWTAYRDYLDNYGDMGDEQTASIELWERHLVYAIAFGCANDILDSVRPQGVQPGDLDNGTALTAMNAGMFSTFNHGLAARAPEPSTSSSGGGSSSFGGGSSFSGGGGGGGGGGGAW